MLTSPLKVHISTLELIVELHELVHALETNVNVVSCFLHYYILFSENVLLLVVQDRNVQVNTAAPSQTEGSINTTGKEY